MDLRNIIRHRLGEKSFEKIRIHVSKLFGCFAWSKGGHIINNVFYSLLLIKKKNKKKKKIIMKIIKLIKLKIKN